MPCRQSTRVGDGLAGDRPSSMPIRATISRIADGRCAGAQSSRGSPGAGSHSSERLGRHRWVIERTLAWFSRFRRLTVRYKRRANIFEAFHHLAASLRARLRMSHGLG